MTYTPEDREAELERNYIADMRTERLMTTVIWTWVAFVAALFIVSMGLLAKILWSMI
jgi:hypothetical protein